MNEINFLPASYRMTLAQRRRTRQHAGVFMLIALCLVGWYMWADHQLDQLEEYAHALHESAETVRAQANDVDRLREEHGDLNRQLWVFREIVHPVSSNQVIAAVGQMMPESVTLSHFSVSTETLKIKKKNRRRGGSQAPAGGFRGQAGGSAGSSARPVALREQSRIHVVMTGLAPGDIAVADFIGKLSEYPLFSKVKMRSSRTVYVGGLIAREFRIEADVPLDREYLPAESSGEVARAG